VGRLKVRIVGEAHDDPGVSQMMLALLEQACAAPGRARMNVGAQRRKNHAPAFHVLPNQDVWEAMKR